LLERGVKWWERRRGARLLVVGVGGKRVRDAGMDAAGEVVREPGGDAPPCGERHGWAGAWRRAEGGDAGPRLCCSRRRRRGSVTARSVRESNKHGLSDGPSGAGLVGPDLSQNSGLLRPIPDRHLGGWEMDGRVSRVSVRADGDESEI